MRILIFVMGIIVIYDSYIHQTPLYYILFLLAGMLAGKVYFYIYSVERINNSFKVRSNRWNIVLTILLLIVRFVVGKPLLESVNVIWAYDAIYLFFIGLYHTKMRSMVKQMDNLIYSEVSKLRARDRR